MKAQLLQHLQYNLWANTSTIAFCKSLPAGKLQETCIGSFPSIEKTWLHIWDAQAIWLDRLNQQPILSWPSANFEGGDLAIFDGILQSSNDLIIKIQSLEKDLSNATISYKNMTGMEYKSSVADIIFHVVNHSTFHRGQIINMLQGLGVENIESTDMITFSRL
jgi:uncharacterized damage-inducible protein DinB